MSILKKLQKLRTKVLEHVEANYASFSKFHIPGEIRRLCPEFLEARLINAKVPNDSCLQFEQEAIAFVNDLRSELETKANKLESNSQELKDQLIVTASKMILLQDYAQVYTHFINCFAYEQDLLKRADVDLTQSIEDLEKNVSNNGDALNGWIRKLESYRSSSQNTDVVMGEDSEFMLDVITVISNLQLENDLPALLVHLQRRFKTCSDQSQGFVNVVINTHLHQWNYNRKFYEDEVLVINLDTIQGWCQSLANILDIIRTQIKKMMTHQKNYLDQHVMQVDFSSYYSTVTNVLEQLLRDAFVIAVQPEQVIKTDNNCKATVRLLIRNVSGENLKASKVKAEMVSAERVQEILETINDKDPFPEPTEPIKMEVDDDDPIPEKINDTKPTKESTIAKMTNSERALTYKCLTGQIFAKFEKMKIKSINRGKDENNRKLCDAVTDEKFALYFRSTISFGDIRITVKKISVPIVVLVHEKQRTQAEATIFWDTYFAMPNRLPFTTPVEIPLEQFAEALNQKMFSSCGRGLSDENLHALAEKVSKTYKNGQNIWKTVTWTAFCKDILVRKPKPELSFTFWEWFHAAHHLIYHGFRTLWSLGYINGFSGRETVESYLINCSRGTFTLRFSDSTLGGISIAWSEFENPEKPIDHIQPINKDNLASKSLVDRLSDLKELEILYPNIPKDEAFGKFQILSSNVYNHPDASNNHQYTPMVMVAHILQKKTTTVSNEASTSQLN